MQKILVLGCPGSGKSTFSAKLGQRTGIPVIHLDAHFWKPGWIECDREEWKGIVAHLMEQESFIMDGNYPGTLDMRLPPSDTVIMFDYSRYLCLYRVLKRRIMNHGRTRADMGKDCPESLDFDFIKYVWNFRKNNRTKIMNKLEEHKGTKNIVIFKNRREVERYLASLHIA